MGRPRRLLPLLLAVTMAAWGCQAGGGVIEDDRPTAGPSPTGSPEPQVARFRTRFNLLRVTGVTCRGLEGPWRVRLRTPAPIQGRDTVRFRLPDGRGPGRLRWSFRASHPGHGTATYSGDLRVRLRGPEDRPVLAFSGTQTAVGVTGRTVARATVRLGGDCPR